MPKNRNNKTATAAKAGVPKNSYTSTVRPGQPIINRGHTVLKQPVNATYKFHDCIDDETLDGINKGDTPPTGTPGASVLDLVIPSVNQWTVNGGEAFVSDKRGVFVQMVSAKLGVRNLSSVPIHMHLRGFYSKYRGTKNVKAAMSAEKIVTLPPYNTAGNTDYTVVDFYQRPKRGQAGLIWSSTAEGEPAGNDQDWYTISSFFFTYNAKTVVGDIPTDMDAIEIITPDNRRNQKGKEIAYGILYEVDDRAYIRSDDATKPVIPREVGVAAAFHFIDVGEFYSYPATAGSSIASFGGSNLAVTAPTWAYPDSGPNEYRTARVMGHPLGGNCFVMYNIDMNTDQFLDPVELNGYDVDDYYVIDPALQIEWDRDQNDSHHPHSHWNISSATWKYDRLMSGFVLQSGYSYMRVSGDVEYHGYVAPHIPTLVGDYQNYKKSRVVSLLEQEQTDFARMLWKEGESGTLKEIFASTAKSLALGLLEYLLTSMVL